MKTLFGRIIPLLLSIVVGTVLSWVSIYAFWFAIWTFHNVAAAQAAGAVGDFVLRPAVWIFEWLGWGLTAIFDDPIVFAGTNGLVVGILIYCVFRAVVTHRGNGKMVAGTPQESRRVEVKARG